MLVICRNLLCVLILIAASVVPVRFAEASASWPNEPSGLTTVLDCVFSNTICNLSNIYNTASYATDSSAPLSPPYVFDTFLCAGCTEGNGKWFLPYPGNPREIYYGVWWKTNPEFQGYLNGANKLFVMHGTTMQGYMGWVGPQDAPKTIGMSMAVNDGLHNNCHISGTGPDCANAPNFFPNVASGTVSAGSGWHRIESYQKASTTPTSRDGILRYWLDGVLIGNYTNVNYMSNGFGNGGEFTPFDHTWDGQINAQCGYRDCSRAWHHYWDHLHLSVGGGGGSASDQPPGPPQAPVILNITVR